MSNSVRAYLILSTSIVAILAASRTAMAQDPAAPVPAAPAAPVTPPAQTVPQATPAPGTPGAGAAPQPGTVIPEIKVTAPKQPPRRVAQKPLVRPPASPPAVVPPRLAAPRPAAPPPQARTPAAPAAPAAPGPAAAVKQFAQKIQNLDQKRENLLPKGGTAVHELGPKELDNIPGGSNAGLNDIVYQLPGVSQDSTSSGDFHIRNEHANVQYRINGILLPDGVAGFAQFLETGFISRIALITGALPAQYGLHTSGVLDITSKSGAALQGGSFGIYGGSRQTFTNNFEYGGVVDNTEYFATGRFSTTGLGLENPTASLNAIHDYNQQGKFFGYTSTLLDDSTRLSTITGMSVSNFEIPTNPGQPLVNDPLSGAFPGLTAYGKSDFSSRNINENQYEKNAYAVVALQRSLGDVDAQLSYFSRYSSLHFVPDPLGDLLFNGVASDVVRDSFLNGIQGDGSYRLTDAHTLRAGFSVSAEQTHIASSSLVEPVDPATGNAIDAPFLINDASNKLGWLLGVYVQDEWKVTDKLTFNTGIRFDQMYQYVDANQFSPRFNMTYKPFWGTVFHAGYARNFTPPPQALGRVSQSQLYNNTTNAGEVPNTGSILPERSDVVDVGVVQQLLPPCHTTAAGMSGKAPMLAANCAGLEVGVDAYYKRATDLLDDGQFGAAYVLTAFNYAKAENTGIEFKAKLTVGNFTAYTNWAIARQMATDVVSNQSLFGADELAYIQNHWINTDHAQSVTGSAGLSYLLAGTGTPWDDTKMSATMIYGSGLRSGFANTDHLSPYGQVNLGLSHEFKEAGWDAKSLTVRFDVVNLFDTIYEIRDGSGIGVFAPQYGPRRGYYMGISQKL